MSKKRDLTKTFIDEIYSKPPKKNYETNKVVYKHIDDICALNLLQMDDYGLKNNRRYTYILVIIDNLS